MNYQMASAIASYVSQEKVTGHISSCLGEEFKECLLPLMSHEEQRSGLESLLINLDEVIHSFEFCELHSHCQHLLQSLPKKRWTNLNAFSQAVSKWKQQNAPLIHNVTHIKEMTTHYLKQGVKINQAARFHKHLLPLASLNVKFFNRELMNSKERFNREQLHEAFNQWKLTFGVFLATELHQLIQNKTLVNKGHYLSFYPIVAKPLQAIEGFSNHFKELGLTDEFYIILNNQLTPSTTLEEMALHLNQLIPHLQVLDKYSLILQKIHREFESLGQLQLYYHYLPSLFSQSELEMSRLLNSWDEAFHLIEIVNPKYGQSFSRGIFEYYMNHPLHVEQERFKATLMELIQKLDHLQDELIQEQSLTESGFQQLLQDFIDKLKTRSQETNAFILNPEAFDQFATLMHRLSTENQLDLIANEQGKRIEEFVRKYLREMEPEVLAGKKSWQDSPVFSMNFGQIQSFLQPLIEKVKNKAPRSF